MKISNLSGKKESFFTCGLLKLSAPLQHWCAFLHSLILKINNLPLSPKIDVTLCQPELFLFVYAIIEARDINILNFMQIRVEEEIFVGTFHWHNVTQIVGQSRTLRCVFFYVMFANEQAIRWLGTVTNEVAEAIVFAKWKVMIFIERFRQCEDVL